jgi:hypothetical protein
VAEVKKELEGCAIYATMLSKDEGMSGGYERCMAEFGVGYGPGGQVRVRMGAKEGSRIVEFFSLVCIRSRVYLFVFTFI